MSGFKETHMNRNHNYSNIWRHWQLTQKETLSGTKYPKIYFLRSLLYLWERNTNRFPLTPNTHGRAAWESDDLSRWMSPGDVTPVLIRPYLTRWNLGACVATYDRTVYWPLCLLRRNRLTFRLSTYLRRVLCSWTRYSAHGPSLHD